MITGATQLGDDRLLLTVDADPRLTAVDCLSGSVIVFVPSGQVFYKKDDGLSTNVTHNVNIKSNVSAVVPPTVNDDATLFYSTGSMWINTATGVVYFLVDPTAGAAVWVTFSGQGTVYQFEIGQELDTFDIPFLNAASEIVSSAKTLTTFSGRRAVPGSSGTTTVQLELNGAPIGGAILSWTPSDLAFALKTVAISVSIVAGDRLSIRLTSAETGGEDVFAEAS
jgi:hypothetical protein